MDDLLRAMLTRSATWAATIAAGYLLKLGLFSPDDQVKAVPVIAALLVGIATLLISYVRAHMTKERLETAAKASPGSIPPKVPA